jgi:hypothetical protein
LRVLNPAQMLNQEPSPGPLQLLRPKALFLRRRPRPRLELPVSHPPRQLLANRYNQPPNRHPSPHRGLPRSQSQSEVGNAQQSQPLVKIPVNRAPQHLRKSGPERSPPRHQMGRGTSLRLPEQHGAESAAGLGQKMERPRTTVRRAQGHLSGNLPGHNAKPRRLTPRMSRSISRK